MALDIYAGTSATFQNTDKLPSPIQLKPTFEQIWSEDTGRAQSGANQAQMIGDSIAEKRTFAIQWGVLTDAEMSTIRTKLTRGFFYFGLGTSLADARTSAGRYYRGEIAGEMMPVGSTVYWKDVSVSVIEK